MLWLHQLSVYNDLSLINNKDHIWMILTKPKIPELLM
jgi:hypothetical protein